MKMTRQRKIMTGLVSLLVLIAVVLAALRVDSVRQRLSGNATIADRLAQYGAAARGRLMPAFDHAGIAYPPASLTLVAIKDQKLLEVYAAAADGGFKLIKTYPILAASGRLGPKLREGDMQVPEGLYAIESLNPNSAYHLALRVGYPNAFDRKQAAADGRTNLGGDIMIHGSNASAGCLAMGDEAAEDLFVLVAETGVEKTQMIIMPVDLRAELVDTGKMPAWTAELYTEIVAKLKEYPRRNNYR